MAFTVAREMTALGNKKVAILKVTSDAAEGNIESGLKYIDAITYALISCSTGTALPHLSPNSNSTGVAANGTLGVSGLTSGDSFHVVCYGR